MVYIGIQFCHPKLERRSINIAARCYFVWRCMGSLVLFCDNITTISLMEVFIILIWSFITNLFFSLIFEPLGEFFCKIWVHFKYMVKVYLYVNSNVWRFKNPSPSLSWPSHSHALILSHGVAILHELSYWQFDMS